MQHIPPGVVQVRVKVGAIISDSGFAVAIWLCLATFSSPMCLREHLLDALLISGICQDGWQLLLALRGDVANTELPNH